MIISDETDGTREALHILLCVSVTKEGLVRMLDPDVIKNVMELIVATDNGNGYVILYIYI